MMMILALKKKDYDDTHLISGECSIIRLGDGYFKIIVHIIVRGLVLGNHA